MIMFQDIGLVSASTRLDYFDNGGIEKRNQARNVPGQGLEHSELTRRVPGTATDLSFPQ